MGKESRVRKWGEKVERESEMRDWGEIVEYESGLSRARELGE